MALLGWLSFQSSFHLPLGKTSCLRQCYFTVHLEPEAALQDKILANRYDNTKATHASKICRHTRQHSTRTKI